MNDTDTEISGMSVFCTTPVREQGGARALSATTVVVPWVSHRRAMRYPPPGNGDLNCEWPLHTRAPAPDRGVARDMCARGWVGALCDGRIAALTAAVACWILDCIELYKYRTDLGTTPAQLCATGRVSKHQARMDDKRGRLPGWRKRSALPGIRAHLRALGADQHQILYPS